VTLATAVILSYNRQDSLRRQLLYYANKPVHLIFADGSDRDWGSGESGSIGEMTWEYFRISGKYTYFRRMAEALRRVNTEFVFRLDDEECILWSGLQKAAVFLSNNSDHSCAGGRCDTTSLSGRRLSLFPHYANNRKLKLDESDAISRINSFSCLNRSRSLFYLLTRTECLLDFAIAAEAVPLEGVNPTLIEYYFDFSLLVCGKYETHDYPFHIRHGGSVQIASVDRSTIDSERVNLFVDLLVEVFQRKNKSNRSFDSIRLRTVISEGIVTMANPTKGKPRSAKNSLRNHFETINARLLFTLGHALFEIIPTIYHLLKPNGVKTFKKFAKVYGGGSEDTKIDLLSIEKIWKKYPFGLSGGQLENELAKF
jgi:glycosyltransferase domain-containing protein